MTELDSLQKYWTSYGNNAGTIANAREPDAKKLDHLYESLIVIHSKISIKDGVFSRFYKGRIINMQELSDMHQETRAIGNIPVNARGDVVKGDVVIKPYSEVAKTRQVVA